MCLRWAAAFLAGATAVCIGSASGAAIQARPPVLLVTIDTLRHDALGVSGAPVATPAIDALAARGVRFDAAVAHTVMTLPSHAAIHTGLDPTRHGVHDNTGFRVSESLDTWAERLGRAGYATGAFVGAFPLDSRFGLAQGFDVYDDYYGIGDPGSLRMVERPADTVVSAARRWIRRQRGEWFAWVHVYDPHAPYLPPPPYDERYPGNGYAGEVAFTDAALAPLLNDADRAGALVVLTSDHGEAFGDHGERTHGIFAYASTLRVPLIVAGVPGAVAASVVTDRVAHADILPTVLEALSEPASGTQGRSFLDRLRRESDPDAERVVYFESLGPNLTRNWAPLRGIFRGRWKLIDLPIPELYDVATDSQERNNLAASDRERVAQLRTLLAAHLGGGVEESSPAPEDPETLRRLRALGYLGGSSSGGGGDEYGPEDDPKNLIRYDNQLQDAIEAAEAGDLEAALQRVEGVLGERPDYGAAYILFANFEYARGNTAAAIARLTVAAASGWSTPDLWAKLAFYLKEAGRLDEARELLEDALTEEPDNVDTMILLATVHGEAGRATDAARLFDRAAELDPTYASLHLNRGMLLLSTGRPVEAEAALQQALQYDPTNSDTYNLLGAIADGSDRTEEALEHWRTAISLADTNYRAMHNLGTRLVILNRFAEAVEVLDRLIAAVPARLQSEYQIPQLREMVAKIKADHGLR